MKPIAINYRTELRTVPKETSRPFFLARVMPDIFFAACLIIFGMSPIDSPAQTFPSKPIRLIISFPPGGTTDAVGRILGQKLSENLGVPVVVENKPGATGMLGADAIARSKADGYTVGIITSAHVVHPVLYRKVPFDPIKDFTPINLLVNAANVICVHPSSPAKTIKELITLARESPGKLTFGSAGNGSSNHLTGEMFKLATNVNIEHVPYKGGGPSLNDLLGGQIPMIVSQMLTVTPYVKSGRIRALAVTSTKREPALPDVPTLIESGFPDFEAAEWFAVIGPAGIPRDVAAKLNSEINRAMHLPDVQAKIASLGTNFIGTTLEQTAAFMVSEMEKWSKVVKDAGLKPE